MQPFAVSSPRIWAALGALALLAGLLAPPPVARAQPSVPAEPVGVTATPGDRQVALAWTPGDDGGSTIIRYEYTFDENGVAVNVWYPVPGSNRRTTSHTVTGLTNGTAYRFRLRAVNYEGNGAVATAVLLPAIPATTPAQPIGLKATPGNSQATLTWTPGFDGGSPILHYEIRQRVGAGAYTPWTIIVDSTAATTSHTVTGLTNGVTYQFQVRAVNAQGPGTTQPESSEPEVAEPETTGPETAEPDTAEPDTAEPDTADSETTGRETAEPDTADSETTGPETAEPDTADSETTGPETAEPKTTEPGTAEPGTAEPVPSEPEVAKPDTAEPETTKPAVPVEVPPAGGRFYSGVITAPNFCTDRSLGGPITYPHDSNGDGIADVCSLPYTRREAIARQQAVIALANQHTDLYAMLVNEACAVTEGTVACGGDNPSAAPPVPPAGGRFYSGVITGPSFCANRSLGGPTTYPHDSNGDGIADVCSLPYTRREAIARQLAGQILAARFPEQFQTRLQSACRSLAHTDFGDNPADSAKDACAQPVSVSS
ncbi:fibronectin type III domain-containing protein [Candidatus Poriferisocius sp.]|uniref:fibronectin type III domain-containing protein n=1 Tax=Candidatus Poriferisocius sp. TaxID=3101276 RepID=UPI003B02DE44